MFKIGYITVLLYLASTTFFLLGSIYQNYFNLGAALGTLFFIIPTFILGIMTKQRIES